MAIADLRREYNLTGLRRADLAAEPLAQFKRWFDQAAGARASGRIGKFLVKIYKAFMELFGSEVGDVNAMVLATADKEGRPSARVVLLKGLDERGFVFYTNYESRKGQELVENPEAALVFYWQDLERQVCIAGTVSRLAPEESEKYFRSRPRGSRIAAWASEQSRPVADRAELDKRWHEFEHRYAGQEVPRPPHWGGYVLKPTRIEFWQGRPSRLHDRFRFLRQDGNAWRVDRLSP